MQEINKLGEECGVFGVYQNAAAAKIAYYGLFALQHRGQESCGIAVSHHGEIRHHKDMGLVNDVFDDNILSSLAGETAIGHVRYSTSGSSVRANAQPLVSKYGSGTMSIVHNGNLSNARRLRRELEESGAIFQTTIDSEAIAYTIAKERTHCKTIEEAVVRAMDKLEGAYSLLVMTPNKLIAARDTWGFRPLCMGKLDDGFVFASESCAFDAVGAEFIRDIEPGEVIVLENGRMKTLPDHIMGRSSRCIFEYIYFARPDSIVDGIPVYEARQEAGRVLAKEHPVEADLVVGVPDSGIDAAIGYAMESGIPYGKGFVKNSYVGRTFIKPTQEERVQSVNIKLNPIRSNVEGKRVVMIDDSIVRGTTCARIVKMLKNAGAKEVHVRISSPPFMHPCYFGTDVPSREELTACNYTIDEIRQKIGADSLGYLAKEDLPALLCGKNYGYCDACFTGVYPFTITDEKEERRSNT